MFRNAGTHSLEQLGHKRPRSSRCAIQTLLNCLTAQSSHFDGNSYRLLAGAYPATVEDFETDRILTTLLELGVNTFVCLQAEFSLHTPESVWRTNQGLRPYIKDAQRLLIRARECQSTRIKQVMGR